ncbi:hypothetical protein CYMTET_5916 [Cymbomonas tetramitiformis]|uniref:ATPase RavA-like AAA lid domain-containing protein n=1 Tax=Cymbomonas tetramitiformis TaxID=36881 RepID=A0AAE0GYL3_9CHLO|nr:hypothetical protein CYMTET_5916 [Cymbomonas tetramitiformis]
MRERSGQRSAQQEVEVPTEVLLLLRDMRAHLRDHAEPPVYISDRRLKKIKNMIVVAAHAQGRSRVLMVDCLLAQHAAWNLPEEQHVIAEWLLEHLCADPAIPQLQFLLEGLTARASKAVLQSAEQRARHGDEVAAVGDELEKLRAAVGVEWTSRRALALSIEAAPRDLWLQRSDCSALQQRVAPRARAQLQGLEELLISIQSLTVAVRVCQNENLQVSKVELLDLVNTPRESTTNGAGESSGRAFGDEELGWSRQEAKANLSADDFREWRRLQRTTRKKNKGAGGQRRRRQAEFNDDDDDW